MSDEETSERPGKAAVKPLFWIGSSRDDIQDFPEDAERGRRMKTAKRTSRVQTSSGNVFTDLCLPNPQERLAKAKLANRICEIITARGLTQTKAAEILSLDQPKISALTRGKLQGFSVERLFRCLNDLDQEIEIIIRPIPPAKVRSIRDRALP